MLFNFPAFIKSVLFYFPSPGNLSDPGIEPRSPALRVDSLPSEPPEKPCFITYFFLTYEIPASRSGNEHGVGSLGFNSWCCHLVALTPALYVCICEMGQIVPTELGC